MLHTIQCPSCGVVLNVPDSAAGKRLKCPQCATKFAAPKLGPADSAIAESSPASSLFPTGGQGSSGSIELPTARPSSGSVDLPPSRPKGGSFDLPSSPAPLRETFDLPLLDFDDDRPRSASSKATAPASAKAPAPAPNKAPAPPKPAPVADALALFQDEPKSARKKTGAEARAHARRCPSCGGVVGVGMSLCGTCGLDLDTGQRIQPLDVFEDDMPVASRPPMPSLGVLFVGSLCAAGFLLLSAASTVAWSKGETGYLFLLVVWVFGLFGSVQFLRRKSMRALFLALSLAVGIGVVFLIVLPIVDANMPAVAPPVIDTVPTDQPIDPDAPHIKPITDQLDMNKISWGIFSLLAYAGLAVYLNSPAMRREFKR